jgi:hypothetical protein
MKGGLGAVRAKLRAVYLGGVRVDCAHVNAQSLLQDRIMSDPAAFDAPLAMVRIPGPAPEGGFP